MSCRAEISSGCNFSSEGQILHSMLKFEVDRACFHGGEEGTVWWFSSLVLKPL